MTFRLSQVERIYPLRVDHYRVIQVPQHRSQGPNDVGPGPLSETITIPGMPGKTVEGRATVPRPLVEHLSTRVHVTITSPGTPRVSFHAARIRAVANEPSLRIGEQVLSHNPLLSL